jgi:hypothetical protein
MPKFLLVPNPIGRYSIGDRTPVLQVMRSPPNPKCGFGAIRIS